MKIINKLLILTSLIGFYGLAQASCGDPTSQLTVNNNSGHYIAVRVDVDCACSGGNASGGQTITRHSGGVLNFWNSSNNDLSCLAKNPYAWHTVSICNDDDCIHTTDILKLEWYYNQFNSIQWGIKSQNPGSGFEGKFTTTNQNHQGTLTISPKSQ